MGLRFERRPIVFNHEVKRIEIRALNVFPRPVLKCTVEKENNLSNLKTHQPFPTYSTKTYRWSTVYLAKYKI
jgi:hypothetical protein